MGLSVVPLLSLFFEVSWTRLSVFYRHTMPKVAVAIVSWNHMKYLSDALTSVRNQTHQDLSLIVVDNASSDGTSEFVRTNFSEAVLLRNIRNLGFSRAYNQTIEYARANLKRDGEELFVLVMNPDIILKPDYIARLLDRMMHRTDVGSAGGKLLRVHERPDGDLSEKDFSDIIDSTGLRIYRSRRAVDRHSGERDTDFDRTSEVFGISGALIMFRISALNDVALMGEFFDEDFFAYKEDVDLAWRLRLFGWENWLVTTCKAYHHRSIAKGEDLITSRKHRGFANKISYRNHFMLLYKNSFYKNLFKDCLYIKWYEFKKFVYLLIFERSTLVGLKEFFMSIPRLRKKRKYIMEHKKITADDIYKWFEK